MYLHFCCKLSFTLCALSDRGERQGCQVVCRLAELIEDWPFTGVSRVRSPVLASVMTMIASLNRAASFGSLIHIRVFPPNIIHIFPLKTEHTNNAAVQAVCTLWVIMQYLCTNNKIHVHSGYGRQKGKTNLLHRF